MVEMFSASASAAAHSSLAVRGRPGALLGNLAWKRRSGRPGLRALLVVRLAQRLTIRPAIFPGTAPWLCGSGHSLKRAAFQPQPSLVTVSRQRVADVAGVEVVAKRARRAVRAVPGIAAVSELVAGLVPA